MLTLQVDAASLLAGIFLGIAFTFLALFLFEPPEE